jgi:hypothetical protein
MTFLLAPMSLRSMLCLMKPPALPQPEALDALRSAILGAGFQPGMEEPSWEKWVAPLGVSRETTKVLVYSLRLLWLLPPDPKTSQTRSSLPVKLAWNR